MPDEINICRGGSPHTCGGDSGGSSSGGSSSSGALPCDCQRFTVLNARALHDTVVYT